MSSVSSKGTFGVKTYLNLKDSKTIFRDNKGKSGIYRFVNLRNGRSYVVRWIYLADLDITFHF